MVGSHNCPAEMICVNIPGKFTCMKMNGIQTSQNENTQMMENIQIPVDFENFIEIDFGGRPTLMLPEKPVKRDQEPDEKNKKYKQYVEEEFKPIVEDWKEQTEKIKEFYDKMVESYLAKLNPCENLECDNLAECEVKNDGKFACVEEN